MIGSINFYYDIHNLNQIKTPEEAAKAFETIFYSFLMKEMEKGITSQSSFSYNFYFDMFMMQIAQIISDSDQTGLKNYILQAIKSYQENSERGNIGKHNTISEQSK
ncbi:MAG: flagellar biosynthesis protein FlgJ [Hydrogenothermaceae bacterium]